MLSRELSEAGFRAEFPPPVERRGVGQEIVHVAMHVASEAESGLIGAAATEGVRRVVQAFRKRHPEVEADTETDGEEEGNERSRDALRGPLNRVGIAHRATSR